MALALSRDPGVAERPRRPSTAAVVQAGREGWDELAWDLAGSLAGFLAMRSYSDDLRQTHERALAAVTRAGNRRGRAYMLRGLGHLAMELVRHDEATASIDRALHAIAAVRIAAGDHARARPELERSRAIFAGVGDRLGEAHVLSRFGCSTSRWGSWSGPRPPTGGAGHLRAVRRPGERGHERPPARRTRPASGPPAGVQVAARPGAGRAARGRRPPHRGLTLHSLGELDRVEGRQAAAVEAFSQALQLCRTVGMPAWEARVQASLEGALRAPGP